MLDKIKLNIISNRKLCENENLEKQIEKIFSAYERKIIHTELQNSDKVVTFSIGEEPHRRLVIDLK